MIVKRTYCFVMIFIFLESLMLFVCSSSRACLKEKQLDLQDAQLDLRMAKKFIQQNQFSKAFAYINLAVLSAPETSNQAKTSLREWYKQAQNYLITSLQSEPKELLEKNLMLLKLVANQNIDQDLKQQALDELGNASRLRLKK